MEEFTDYCTRSGFDAETLTPEQRQALQAAWRASTDKAERLTAFRDQFKAANNIVPPRGDAVPAATTEAAMLVGLGVAERHVARWYGERVVDHVSQKGHRFGGIQQLLRQTMSAAGRTPPSGKFTDGDIADAFHADRLMSGGGTSTYSLSGILSNVANKSLLAGFLDTPMTWSSWAKVGSNVDFKEAARYRLTGTGEFKKVAPSGEIKHISLTESSATATLDTYGAMLAINRTSIINDDLSAFQAAPRVLARMSAIKVEKVAVTTLLANVGGTTNGFFSTSHVNYTSGAGSALQDSALATAYLKFREQTDANGDPIMVPPALLVVPPALEFTARKLIDSSAMVGTTTANTLLPDGNPWKSLLTLVVVPHLGDAFGITNSSDTGWYLLCAPGDYSCVEVNFLNGQQSPTVETAELDFATLGIQMRAFHDFSANTLEYRGGVLNAGA